MAAGEADTTKFGEEAITRGTGNVFAGLGYPDAEERQTKLRLAHAMNELIQRRRLTQAAAAAKMGIGQPKVSALVNYRLEGFSIERLMTLLTALDQDVESSSRQTAVASGRAHHGERGVAAEFTNRLTLSMTFYAA